MTCNATNLTIKHFAFAMALCPMAMEAFAQGAAAIRVRTATAEPRVFESRITVQGSVEAKTRANVSARVPGNVDEIWVDEGDKVVAGETKLFQIDPVSLSNQVTIAERSLAVARSNSAVSEANYEKVKAEAAKVVRDYERYERLHKEGRVTDNEFEVFETQLLAANAGMNVARAQIELAKSQVEQSEAQLMIVRKALSDSLIIAPISGFVSSRTADPGEFVSAGEAIMTIVDTADLEAAAFIPAQYFGRIAVGTTELRLASDGVEIGKCKADYKSPVVNPSLRTFEVKGKIAGNGEIAPGMMVDMTIVFEAREGLAVPTGAVLSRGGKSIVFVSANGKAVKREVRIGLQNEGYAEVLEGLSATDKVIVEGHTLVRDGSEISE